MAGIIPPHGGYRKLASFQVAQRVYDLTVAFVERYVEVRSRTRDQMVQAARSGTQNIAEGSMASATSKKMELKLTGVARASLEELRLDYEDFLRQRGLRLWGKDEPQTLKLRAKLKEFKPWSDRSDESDKSDLSDFLDSVSPEFAANLALCFIHQATYLLRRQMASLEEAFLNCGGFTDRLYHARKERRSH
jgi:four helix bundle suffix protein